MKKRYFYYGILARTHKHCCNSTRITFIESTLQEQAWCFAVAALRDKTLKSFNIACVLFASAFVSKLTDSKYHIALRSGEIKL